jgi:hypothetical protein
MLALYGLGLTTTAGGEPQIARSGNWGLRRGVWLTPRNHNHLRLTRILACLYLLGLPGHAKALFQVLDELARGDGGGVISEAAHAYWRSAAGPGRRAAEAQRRYLHKLYARTVECEFPVEDALVRAVREAVVTTRALWHRANDRRRKGLCRRAAV